MTELLQIYKKLHRIEQDIGRHKATKKQIAYLEERRSVISQILDLVICTVQPDCEQTKGFLERQKQGLLDHLSDFESYPQALLRAVLDDFGAELKQQMDEVESSVALYKCGPVDIEGLESRLLEIAALKALLFERIEADTRAGRIPNYELLIAPWMLLIEVQNQAIAFRSALDEGMDSLLVLKQRASLENPKYSLIRYGQEMLKLRDAIVSIGEDELRRDLKSWQSVYDQLEVHLNHLRGMVEFAEVQYSKGIQDETALLNRIFLIGVVAQLMTLFTVTNHDVIANFRTAGPLIVLSVIPPMILFHLLRRRHERLTRKERLKALHCYQDAQIQEGE